MPGTGGHGASCLDGYAMTKQGRSQEALAISTFSSVIGGLVTTLLTIAFLPILSKIGLHFRSVEMVVIMVFGLCLIAMIATHDLVKGLIAEFLWSALRCGRDGFHLWHLAGDLRLYPALRGRSAGAGADRPSGDFGGADHDRSAE